MVLVEVIKISRIVFWSAFASIISLWSYGPWMYYNTETPSGFLNNSPHLLNSGHYRLCTNLINSHMFGLRILRVIHRPWNVSYTSRVWGQPHLLKWITECYSLLECKCIILPTIWIKNCYTTRIYKIGLTSFPLKIFCWKIFWNSWERWKLAFKKLNNGNLKTSEIHCVR